MTDDIMGGRAGRGAAGPVMVPTPQAGPPGPLPAVAVDDIEVTQAVQDLAHSAPLVAGKRTVVRVYLSTAGGSPVTVRGTLAVRPAGTVGWTQIPSTADVVVDPAASGLRLRREDLERSLNFLLPADLVKDVQQVEVAVAGLEKVNPVTPLPGPFGAVRHIEFRPSAPLRVRVIGIRYEVPGPGGAPRAFEPAAVDYALIRSWLGRAYPTDRVVWSQTVVDWPAANPWPTDDNTLGVWGRDVVNPFLSALRAQDMAGGMDHRTHYYGLASDGGGFLRGWASTIPSGPDPTAVACGPAGRPGGSFGWDTDGSYADWYTAHELCHTFGRMHPGFPPGSNSRDDLNFPYPDGQLSTNDGVFVGYDAGDPEHGIAPRALPGAPGGAPVGQVWHDVMTYSARQWLSRYTYEGVYHRLIAEDALPAPGPGGGGPTPAATVPPGGGGGPMTPGQPAGIHVVARINTTKGTGRFVYVTPVNAPAAAGPAPDATGYALRVRRANDPAIDYPAAFRKDACGDPNDTEETGSVDLVIPNDPQATALELVSGNNVLDTFTPGVEPPEPTNVRSATAAGGGPSIAAAPATGARPKVTWTPVAPAPGPGPNIAAAGPPPTYTVQVSTDGTTWQTVGVGLTSPEAAVDPQFLAGRDKIRVRVTATNGFRTRSTTQVIDVNDL